MQKLLLVLVALALATFCLADWIDNEIAVTAISRTVVVSPPMSTVWLRNDGQNEAFICLWRQGETVVACTATDAGRRLDAAEAKSWESTPEHPWAAITVICSAGEATMLRGEGLP